MSETYENCPSESSKYKALTRQYCRLTNGQPGCGVDIASQGDPVVPWAIQFDLPPQEFAFYNDNHLPRGPIQLTGWAQDLPFESNSLDFVFSSHLLEDFLDWDPILTEWTRVLKPGGNLIILVPDKELWAAALAKGQPPNCAHKHESYPGELSTYAAKLGLSVIKDELTALFPGDYTILFVGRKNLG